MYMSSINAQHESQQTPIETARFSRLLRLAPQFELLCGPSHAKTAAEKLISAGFQRGFSAKLESFMPQLLSMHCMGRLSGVAGICFAGNQQLFLEQYLETPIESELAAHSKLAINRDSIAEIGNLVAANNGASLAVFIVLACSLKQAGFTHMVFTATEGLREKFRRLGLSTCFIADADVNKLETGTERHWGTYYQTKPQVIAGELATANALINQRPLYNCIQTTFSKQIDALTEQLVSLRGAA